MDQYELCHPAGAALDILSAIGAFILRCCSIDGALVRKLPSRRTGRTTVRKSGISRHSHLAADIGPLRTKLQLNMHLGRRGAMTGDTRKWDGGDIAKLYPPLGSAAHVLRQDPTR